MQQDTFTLFPTTSVNFMPHTAVHPILEVGGSPVKKDMHIFLPHPKNGPKIGQEQASDLYSGSVLFNSSPGHWLSWLTFEVFLSASKQTPGQYVNTARAASFPIHQSTYHSCYRPSFDSIICLIYSITLGVIEWLCDWFNKPQLDCHDLTDLGLWVTSQLAFHGLYGH